jgi:hypothetical protein
MTDQRHEPYPLEPHEDDEQPKRREEDGKGRIEAPGLLSGFPEDADFDRDPEVDRVIAGPRPEERNAAEREEAPAGEELVQSGFAEARVWAIVGAVLLISAMIAAAVNAPDRHVARVLLTLYNALLHTGTGVVALFIAAVLTERRLGSFELAAARMFTAVAAFSLLFNLHLNLIGENWAHWKVEELLLASVAYVLIVASTFRLWQLRNLAYVVGSHFFLWLVVYVGMLLARYVGAPVGAV